MCSKCVLQATIPFSVCFCKCKTDHPEKDLYNRARGRVEKVESRRVYCSECGHEMAYP